MKTIVTITGIRPDFIRMSFIFKELDKHFNHILIHTGQHYDEKLSNVFFKELNIRNPDYTLNTGKMTTNHYEQLSYLSTAIPELFKTHSLNPDLIIFLGDSNSVGISFPLKKQGYRIGHIEAGMRSYDRRMLEEINRTVCDHCSDILFVYHDDYKLYLSKENIIDNVHVVGNTIVEPLRLFQSKIMSNPKRKDMILMDIHRPENFNYPIRLKKIINFANDCINRYGVPVKLLYFKRLSDSIKNNNIEIGNIEMIELLPYEEYLNTVYHCKFIISDSGTGQEEPALLNTQVVVPREFTERPQSFENNCSIQLLLDEKCNRDNVFEWIDSEYKMNTEWLGNGTTSTQIVKHLTTFFSNTTQINITPETYQHTKPYPYMMQDNFLKKQFAKNIQQEILSIPENMWDRYNNPFEQKWTLRDKFNFPPLLTELFEELESDEFVKKLSEIVGYDLKIDPSRNFWGVHKYDSGDYLDIHVDAGIHPTVKSKKQVTFGIYLSSDWDENYGCDLEVWSGDNASNNDAKIYEKIASISPIFNRMIMFTCNDYSWHGNPTLCSGTDSSKRIFITMSFLSDNHTDLNKRPKAFFVSRPNDPVDEEKDKLRFLRADPEKYAQVYRTDKM